MGATACHGRVQRSWELAAPVKHDGPTDLVAPRAHCEGRLLVANVLEVLEACDHGEWSRREPLELLDQRRGLGQNAIAILGPAFGFVSTGSHGMSIRGTVA